MSVTTAGSVGLVIVDTVSGHTLTVNTMMIMNSATFGPSLALVPCELLLCLHSTASAGRASVYVTAAVSALFSF